MRLRWYQLSIRLSLIAMLVSAAFVAGWAWGRKSAQEERDTLRFYLDHPTLYGAMKIERDLEKY